MKIKIKYFEGAKKLEKIAQGDWIDVYANEDIFIPKGEMRLIPLGIAMELPKRYEAHLAPRSSTFKRWGIIQTNHIGIIDNSYSGDNDEWKYPAFCLESRDILETEENGFTKVVSGTWIRKGDKIAQFRIMRTQPKIKFEEVEVLGNEDRGSFGSTGSR